jgi:hypothetical protein
VILVKLRRVRIVNFRSIIDTTLEFDERTRILVGINESGKTNILRALRLLGSFEPGVDDIRIQRADEPPADENKVIFVFGLEKDEVSELLDELYKVIYLPDYEKPFLKLGNKQYSLSAFLEHVDILYRVDVKSKKKSWSRWGNTDEGKLVGKWHSPTGKCDIVTGGESGPGFDLKTYKFISPDTLEEYAPEKFAEVEWEQANEIVFQILHKYLDDKLPDVIFWEYDKKYDLPRQVPLTAFSQSPDTCVPLKCMFELAGIDGSAGLKRVRNWRFDGGPVPLGSGDYPPKVNTLPSSASLNGDRPLARAHGDPQPQMVSAPILATSITAQRRCTLAPGPGGIGSPHGTKSAP